MVEQVPFLAAPPNLADARYVSALRELFAVNQRNVVLLGIYFVVLLVVAYSLIGWLTGGWRRWDLNLLGWALVTVFALLPALPVWRLVVEEGPRLAYQRPFEAYARLQPVRGTVTRHGLGVGMGRPLAMRKLHWALAQPPLEGSTPYLPAPIALQAPEGTGVWVGVDPTGSSKPLFLGFAR